MPNPFKTMTNTTNIPNMANYRKMYQAFKSGGNPMQMFTNMAQQNPALQPILQSLNNGGNAETIFKNMCKERNIDPNEFIKNITG